jgi:hypothetical protein
MTYEIDLFVSAGAYCILQLFHFTSIYTKCTTLIFEF